MKPLTRKQVLKAIDMIGPNNTEVGDWSAYQAREQEREAAFWAIDERAKVERGIIGRIVRYAAADGFAVYIITGATKYTVELDLVDLWDGYRDGYLQWGGTFERERIMQKIWQQEKLVLLESRQRDQLEAARCAS